ncbi:MAG: helix-turn-helix domain-containing protein [Acidimicrobiia bacterium]|nr:helix-turn-helix domain-containing protein [Acidimicrobiia bacterium]
MSEIQRLALSVTEAAKALGVSHDLVYELVARAELPVIELGRRKVIPVVAIERLIEVALDGFDPPRAISTLAATKG